MYLLTTHEAAEYLRLKERKVYELIAGCDPLHQGDREMAIPAMRA
jgi:hypothetical protein